VRQGYNNIRIRREDQHKAAFKTEFGIFVPNVMFFSLTNSPATFQRMMDSIFQHTTDKPHLLGTEILVYMDDILIASLSGLAGHRAVVHNVLAVLEEHDLYLKPEKCVWEADSVDYLRLILEKGVTRMDPTKVEGVWNWATPTTKKHVRSFLGFCNFYCAFIRGFAKLAKPLNNLTKKDAPWIWGNDEQNTFDILKRRITEEPILRQPQMDQQFKLEVDASGYALGAVLMQRQEDGKCHPMGFYSTTLNDTERNYDIYDLELLAVVKSLENWRTYLAGSPHKVIVFTDHMNLQYWRDPHKISRRVARQVLRLAEYDIELRHIPGKTNRRADALSRLPNYDQGEDDNEDMVVLPENLFVRLSLTEDEEPQNEKTLRPWVDPHNLREVDGVWWKEGRRVVTRDIAYRRQVVHDHHDLPAYGHPGISHTTALTERHYWWPRMRQEIHDYVGGCADCQWHKVNTQARKAPLAPIFPNPEAMPFETVAMDFIVKLPLSNGFDSILTITDHDCTKAAIFIPCNETITAKGVAELYLQHVFKRFRLPQKIISDRDPRLAGKFAKALCTALGITQNMSTAFHPRTDGQSERTNQGLEQYLRFYVDAKQSNWAQLLSIAEFAHNSWRNESTGQSPFDLLMGYHPRAEWTTVTSPIPQVTLRLEQIQEARDRAKAAMIKAQQGWERRECTAPTFQTGDQVWLDGRNIKMFHPTAKLAPKRHGPFPIIRVLSPINYELRLPVQWKLHPVFHVDLLTPYRETEFHGVNYDKPPPDLINGEEEYEVERIVALRRFGRGHKLQYLVKWKGYPDAENQWVNKEDVFAEDAVKEFQNLTSDPKTRIRRVRIDSDSPHPSSVTSSAATSSVSAKENPPVSDRPRGVSAITPIELMIIPEAPHAPTESPSRRYDDTCDFIGGADPPPGTISPEPLPTRPRHGAAEVVARGRSAVEGPATRMRSSMQTEDRTAAVARHLNREELFPAKHPLIRLGSATLPDDTLYVRAMDGTPVFRDNTQSGQPPPGFVQNRGNDYVPFITTYNGVQQPVNFVQTILTSNLLVIGLREDSSFVYAKSLHTTPEYLFRERPIYALEDLEVLNGDHTQRAMIDRKIAGLTDVTVLAEVIRYRALTTDLAYSKSHPVESERQWDETSFKMMSGIHRLEMANVLARLEVQRDAIFGVDG
jgi:hypothetical protein